MVSFTSTAAVFLFWNTNMAAVMSLPSDSDFTANNTLLMRSCVQHILIPRGRSFWSAPGIADQRNRGLWGREWSCVVGDVGVRFHLPARPTGYKEAQERRQRKFPSMYLDYLISLKKIDEDQVVSSKAKLYSMWSLVREVLGPRLFRI